MIDLIRKLVMLGCCLCFAMACGANATPPERTTSHNQLSAEERFSMHQQAMCDALAPRLTTCAVEQARKNLTEREIEKQGLSDPAFLRKYTNDIRSECSLKEISMRQIKLLETCTAQDSDCKTYLSCLDTVQAKPPTAPS